MHIEHVALWTHDLERLRAFYERWFGATSGARYDSTTHPGFSSFFLTFPGGGGRLELMRRPAPSPAASEPASGYAHIALAVGSRDAVDALAARMAADGVRLTSTPRQTGDGYYEAVVEDPDGNRIEITV